MSKRRLIDLEDLKTDIKQLPLTYHFIEFIDLSKLYFVGEKLKVEIKKIGLKRAVKRTFPKNITLF